MYRSMSRLFYVLCLPLLALTWTGCEAERPGVSYGVLQQGDVLRTYRLYTPPLLKKSEAVPLLVALHGSGSTSIQFAQESRFDALADSEGFLVVYPDAVESNWNDGRKDPAFPSGNNGLDDVAFVRAVVDNMVRK